MKNIIEMSLITFPLNYIYAQHNCQIHGNTVQAAINQISSTQFSYLHSMVIDKFIPAVNSKNFATKFSRQFIVNKYD